MDGDAGLQQVFDAACTPSAHADHELISDLDSSEEFPHELRAGHFLACVPCLSTASVLSLIASAAHSCLDYWSILYFWCC
mmetsp:Transcript_40372/g.64116  ORF Transcript_40372/g.64116 Transcript_40372/m.64116 type:complete len:80 (-) Transcript_40372:22-261(-)